MFHRPDFQSSATAVLPRDLQVKFRTSRFGIAPYVTLDFPAYLVKEIVCGPKCTMREQHSVLRQFLKIVGFSDDIHIRNSLAAYR